MMNLTIQPPLGGMVRRTGFQNQEPFTAYSIENFWPFDPDTGRAVTASRPAQSTLTSPGSAINLLCRINGGVSGKPYQSLVAGSSGNLYWFDDTVWRAATGSGAASIDTGRPVFATPFLQHVFITKADAKPLDFDYVTGTVVSLEESFGSTPTDCRIAFVHQGSLCLAGQLGNPHILYMSRTGDAYDWDFSADLNDYGGAFATAGEDEGLLNGPVTAGFSHTSDSSVVSTFEGIKVLRGHPRRGGEFEEVSNNNVYILGQGAWCKTPDDTAFFLTKQGLMALSPQPGAVAALVSKKVIPDELIGLAYDYEDPSVAMAYDSRWDCIYISDRTSEQAWMYRLDGGSFQKMPLDNYPYVMVSHEPLMTANLSSVLFGKSA